MHQLLLYAWLSEKYFGNKNDSNYSNYVLILKVLAKIIICTGQLSIGFRSYGNQT